MTNTLEESLNGGYNGLYGEVVTEDTYRLRDVADIVSVNDPNFIHVKGHKRGFAFEPDIIFDIGANVGVFTRYAKELFPNAVVISVEPHPANINIFEEYTSVNNTVLIKKALGTGQLWRKRNSVNGSGESYMSTGLGINEIVLSDETKIEESYIETIMLSELISQHLSNGQKSILKLDCEGGESVIWNHQPSMEALKKIDYITGEFHFIIDEVFLEETKKETLRAIEELKETHTVEIDLPNFWALKNKQWK